MIGEAGRVSIVRLDAQVGFVVQQTVQHMGCVTYRSVNDFGGEGRILIGDMGIKLHAWFLAVFQINLTPELPAATRFEVLSIRR